jgi:hypothetical protein
MQRVESPGTTSSFTYSPASHRTRSEYEAEEGISVIIQVAMFIGYVVQPDYETLTNAFCAQLHSPFY